MHGTDVTKS